MKLADAIATAPRRTLKGTYWHQGPTRHPVTSCADPARGPGRYHRTGEPGVWYASNKEQGAWAELFRHFVDDGVDPFEVRRRVGRVAVTLQVLDLTDERTRSHLGVDETDLLPTTTPPPRPSPPPAMPTSTPYWPRRRRSPVVKHLPCSFTHCPTSSPSDPRSVNRLRGSPTYSR